MRTILLGASNAWFPVVLSELSIPSERGPIDQAVEEHCILEKITSREVLQFALDTNEQLAGLRARGGGPGGDRAPAHQLGASDPEPASKTTGRARSPLASDQQDKS